MKNDKQKLISMNNKKIKRNIITHRPKQQTTVFEKLFNTTRHNTAPNHILHYTHKAT